MILPRKTFDDYLGQKELKDKLAVYTQAAKMRQEPGATITCWLQAAQSW